MGDRKLIVGGTIVTGFEVIQGGFVLIEGQKIVDAGRIDQLPDTDARVIMVPSGYLVMPGFIDMHVHGALGADVMDGRDALEVISTALAAEGVTGFLPTVMTDSEEKISRALSGVGSVDGAEVLGIHLEGPFINRAKAGAQPVEYIRKYDKELFREWQMTAAGMIKLITVAPETDVSMVRELVSEGVIVSAGHTDATYLEMIQAIAEGVSHVTHLFNGMRGMHHREPGIVGASLLDKRVQVEIIYDGIHVRDEMVELVYRLKGSEGIILVTDGMRAKGLSDGEYELAGQKVVVRNKEARLESGVLAGSTLRMNEAVRRASSLGDLADLVRMSSLNAAIKLGIEKRKGSIERGKDADLVIVDPEFGVWKTYCRGDEVYDAGAMGKWLSGTI